MNTEEESPPQFLSVSDLELVFGVGASTIRSWIKNGVFGEHYEMVGHMYFVRREAAAEVVRRKYNIPAEGER